VQPAHLRRQRHDARELLPRHPAQHGDGSVQAIRQRPGLVVGEEFSLWRGLAGGAEQFVAQVFGD